jgi:hypothetical protein
MNGFNWWAFEIKHAAVNAIKKVWLELQHILSFHIYGMFG